MMICRALKRARRSRCPRRRCCADSSPTSAPSRRRPRSAQKGPRSSVPTASSWCRMPESAPRPSRLKNGPFAGSPNFSDPARLTLSDPIPVLCWAGLPVNVRLCFGQPCSPFWVGGFSVHAAAWRIHIRRRAAVLSNPPRPERFRPASARNKAALGTLGSSARCSGSRPLTPLATAFGGSAFGLG